MKKVEKLAFRRLRSKSFDGNPDTSDTRQKQKQKEKTARHDKNSKVTLPPLRGTSSVFTTATVIKADMTTHFSDTIMTAHGTAPRLEWKGPIILWRAKISAEVMIFYHPASSIFEVASIDCATSNELNRLYIPRSQIENIVKSTPYMAFVQVSRRDLISRALLRCCTDFISGSLDSTPVKGFSLSAAEAASQIVVLNSFDGPSKSTRSLSIPKPLEVRPVDLSLQASTLFSGAHHNNVVATLQYNLQSNLENISRLTEVATEHLLAAEQSLDFLMQHSNAKDHVNTSSHNPNFYSSTRWKWIWSIREVIHKNRTIKILKEVVMLKNKKKIAVGISTAEMDCQGKFRGHASRLEEAARDRRKSFKQIIALNKHEISNLTVVASNPTKLLEFRKFAYKARNDPLWKISVPEILNSINVKPKSFFSQKEEKTE